MHNEIKKDYNHCATCGEDVNKKEWFIPFNYHAICRDCCKSLANLFWCKETEEALKSIEELGKQSAHLRQRMDDHLSH